MGYNVLKRTSQLTGRPDRGHWVDKPTHEQAIEVHACRRLAERYGVPIEMTPEVMIDHLAMILAGESVLCFVQVAGYHAGKEVRIVVDRGIRYFVSYDPRLLRIATYLPPNTSATRRQTRSARTIHGRKMKDKQ